MIRNIIQSIRNDPHTPALFLINHLLLRRSVQSGDLHQQRHQKSRCLLQIKLLLIPHDIHDLTNALCHKRLLFFLHKQCPGINSAYHFLCQHWCLAVFSQKTLHVNKQIFPFTDCILPAVRRMRKLLRNHRKLPS